MSRAACSALTGVAQEEYAVTSSPGRFTSIALLAAVLVGGSASAAEVSKIYYTQGSSIGRANLDGSHIEPILTGHGSPRGIALDVT